MFPTPYPVATDDDSDVWVMLRRSFWYVDDLVSHQIFNRHIRSAERCLLDALRYAQSCGMRRAPTAAICSLTPLLRPQTVPSILDRLQKRGLVEDELDGRDKIRRWWLTTTGVETCEDYEQEVEKLLELLLGGIPDNENALLRRAPAALDLVNSLQFPRMLYHSDGRSVRPPNPASKWAALRRVHCYTSDYLYGEMRLFGVKRPERRVMDALGYARKSGFNGLNVGTIIRLSRALTRPVVQTALTNLETTTAVKPKELDQAARSTGRVLWELTDIGDAIRKAYKIGTQLKLREVYDPNEEHVADFTLIARHVHEHRDRMLKPALEYRPSVA